ncbi:MAG: bifunctional 4-hydroxy-3-methylbut-2-enyl diphosphate reductase/30S ribosomal protein S1 [Clostridiales bacterium]|nr:bifunctional 4-hydroxy-3-methylbut-2-enyl diphosphate reductase/30S ribosomal protein S1 [Clostridiales bacterium]
MPIVTAKHAGFCMGVRRAVDEAMKASKRYGAIATIGELVHNPQVIRRLETQGVHAVDTPAEAAGKTAVIRSHGVAPGVYADLETLSCHVLDLTCPFVQRLHETVSRYSGGGKPVILAGQRDHPEVTGTIGWCRGEVYTVSSAEQAETLPELHEALFAAQTTFPPEQWENILPIVRGKVGRLTVEDTICTATAQRQNEARELASEVDAMLILGGKKSANTRKLYETCSAICPRTLLIESANDIPADFADIHSEIIGITTGTSTPDWLLKEVVTRMTDKEQMDRQVPAEVPAETPAEASAETPAETPVEAPAEEMEENSFMADVEATLVKIRPGQTVTGTVVQMTDEEVCVNIGFKSDGLIKREDLITEGVQMGDEIEVEVVKVNDGDGNVLLSQRNILKRKAFAKLVEKFDNDEYVEGVGKEVVKGGLICDVDGIRAFVPASQLSNRYVEKIGEFVGQTLTLKIIELDEQKRRIVASRKAVLKAEETERKAEVWASLEEGAVIKGIVRRLTDFGAFVDIGGVDGLIHVTDLSWSHVKHPSEIVHPDQEVDVKILNLDHERERIQLGLKQMQPKPWDVAPQKYPEGSVVIGKVVRITTFGAFVELEPGVDGLVHISQCATTRIDKVEDAVTVGDEINVKVLSIDPQAKRISLSIRALLEADEPVKPAREEKPKKPEVTDEIVPVDIEAVGRQLEEEALKEEKAAEAKEEAPAKKAEEEPKEEAKEEPAAEAKEEPEEKPRKKAAAKKTEKEEAPDEEEAGEKPKPRKKAAANKKKAEEKPDEEPEA